MQKGRNGQDFGFTNDPSAAVRCGIIDNRLYVDELFYETDMLSSAIANRLKPFSMKVFADSQDPRLIQEIKNRGVNIYPVDKFPAQSKRVLIRLKTWSSL